MNSTFRYSCRSTVGTVPTIETFQSTIVHAIGAPHSHSYALNTQLTQSYALNTQLTQSQQRETNRRHNWDVILPTRRPPHTHHRIKHLDREYTTCEISFLQYHWIHTMYSNFLLTLLYILHIYYANLQTCIQMHSLCTIINNNVACVTWQWLANM